MTTPYFSSALLPRTGYQKTFPNGNVGSTRLALRGGFFQLGQFPNGKPMNFAAGMKLFYEAAIPSGGSYEETLLSMGKKMKDKWISFLEEGKGTPLERPLAEMTETARVKKGNKREPFLYETGQLVKNTEVKLMKGGKITKGAAGVAIVPGKGTAPHQTSKGMTQWNLFNILCREGLVVYADQLSKDQLAKLMAWRSHYFGNIREKKLSEEYMRRNKGDPYEAATIAKQLNPRKPIINIPPRPLFSDTMEEELGHEATAMIQKILGNSFMVAARAFGYERVTYANLAAYKKKMYGIKV